MQRIINVISGKGGTGKTLMTAVMAEMLGNKGLKVLVVDLDIFVRGLTTLLYFQRNENIKITHDNELTVSDFFKCRGKYENRKNIAISRYRSFDVFPSVALVDEILSFKGMMPNSIEDAKEILDSILISIPPKYDFIFLDSRAGYDELISATHQVSDFSLCVEEDDDISMITSDNLIAQLKNDVNKPVLRIRNKTRQLEKDYGSLGITFVGHIPFDTDVMNSFGTKYFWHEIEGSLYKASLIKAWNSIAKKMGLDIFFENKRINPLGNGKVEVRLSMLSLKNRVMFVYGILITFLSFCVTFTGSEFIEKLIQDPIKLAGAMMSVMGICFIMISIFQNNKK